MTQVRSFLRERRAPTGAWDHWEALDEDISVDGLLTGHGDLTQGRVVAAA